MGSRDCTCLALLGLVMTVAACGNSTPPPRPVALPIAASASASEAPREPEPPDGVMPRLNVGAIRPGEDPTVHDLRLVGRHVADGYETLAAELWDGASWPIVAAIDVAPGQPAPAAFVQGVGGGNPYTLWIRRVAPLADAPVTGDLFAGAGPEGVSGKHHRFRISGTRARASDPKVRIAWLRALAGAVRDDGRRAQAWDTFAAARLEDLAAAAESAQRKGKPSGRARVVRNAVADDDFAELMETMTGATAVQEALQQHRSLFLQVAREKATVPIAALKLPPLAHHPWKTMMARLESAPAELLAASAPADFYYARATDLPSLFRLFDQIDAWGTPAATILDGSAEDRAVASRYEVQLALRRGPLTRALGPTVIGEVALVGSDPYVKEGSDVTVILRVKDRPLLEAALAATLADLAKDHGKISRTTRAHGGVTVNVARSPDGAVTQQLASLGDLEVVSNSQGAMDVVLDTSQARHPKLADEPDFQFMLARDAKTRADILAYMGDRFVGEVVGPKQKVLEARRQIALGELMTPGFAALLYGWTQGKSPTRAEDLFSASLLTKAELAHANGAPITWQPGVAARSSWGTPAAMTPLIDLPTPDLVTVSERAAYDRFARGYQDNWSAYIDPIALRIAFDGEGQAHTMSVDLRELPLIDGTDYHDVAEFVGNAHFAARGLAGGLRLVAGIGPDAEPRRELARTLRGFSSHGDMKFDWIGEWAMVGVADRAELAAALLTLAGDEVPQLPAASDGSHGDLAALTTLPLYAEIAVKSPVQAALALAGLRVVAEETIPGMFEWGEVARHRDVPMVRISVKKEVTHGMFDAAPSVDVFYAVTNGALVVTLQQWLLAHLIDEQLDGNGPTASPVGAPGATQLSFELGSERGKALWTVLGWLLEEQVLEASSQSSRSAAEALLRGAPETANDAAATRALGLAYFGAAPLTPDGAQYVLARDGVRDPARGTPYAPVWPDVPVPGSPVERVMLALARIRTEVAFDDEGKDGSRLMRSLHARATFGLH
jgi:hypothetical protein